IDRKSEFQSESTPTNWGMVVTLHQAEEGQGRLRGEIATGRRQDCDEAGTDRIKPTVSKTCSRCSEGEPADSRQSRSSRLTSSRTSGRGDKTRAQSTR